MTMDMPTSTDAYKNRLIQETAAHGLYYEKIENNKVCWKKLDHESVGWVFERLGRVLLYLCTFSLAHYLGEMSLQPQWCDSVQSKCQKKTQAVFDQLLKSPSSPERETQEIMKTREYRDAINPSKETQELILLQAGKDAVKVEPKELATLAQLNETYNSHVKGQREAEAKKAIESAKAETARNAEKDKFKQNPSLLANELHNFQGSEERRAYLNVLKKELESEGIQVYRQRRAKGAGG